MTSLLKWSSRDSLYEKCGKGVLLLAAGVATAKQEKLLAKEEYPSHCWMTEQKTQ